MRPSRERWAEMRQHPYWDSETGCPFANKFGPGLSNYAPPEEVAALIANLKELYRELGREMRAAKQQAGSLNRQPGETDTAWYWRVRALPEAEKDIACKPADLQSERREINGVLAKIQNDEIPKGTRWCSHVMGERAAALVAPFAARYLQRIKDHHRAEAILIGIYGLEKGFSA
jgi:hypothetical protein